MLKILDGPAEELVSPQAIIMRPIDYFTAESSKSCDDLDDFLYTSYIIGNSNTFDLRHYEGHPSYTVTVYMPFDVVDEAEISSNLKAIFTCLEVPKFSIAWKRGQPFEYGKISRPSEDRLREHEARLLALKIASRSKDGCATTEYIKKSIAEYYNPSTGDLRPSATRRHEQRWQQIVGNVISHKDSPGGPFTRGLARRTLDGLCITEKGRNYLKSLGFSR